MRRNRAQLLAGAIAAAVVLVVSYGRWQGANRARWPGHADAAFYFDVAQNIRAGHGFKTNYVWEFLSQTPTSINHYAFGYWFPLASILIAGALLFGSGVSAALHLNIIASIGFAAATYCLARQLVKSPWLRATAAALVVVLPAASTYMMRPETGIYCAAFSTAALAAAVAARRRPNWWVGAGIFAALAHLTRNEGLILIAVLALATWLWTRPGRAERGGALIRLLVPYFVVMLPLFVMSMANLGSPLPSASSKFPFITNFEDIYSLRVDRSLSSLLGGGVGPFLSVRGHALIDGVDTFLQAMNPVVAVLVLVLAGIGVGRAIGALDTDSFPQLVRRFGQSVWFLLLGFPVAEFLFSALVTPIVSVGAVPKMALSASGGLIVTGFAFIERLGMRDRTLVILCGVLVAFSMAFVNSTTTSEVAAANATGDAAARLGVALRPEQECLTRPLVLMTRNPWEFTQATGIPSVQIPNGSIDEILATARRYGVTDIQLTATREALKPIGELTSATGPLEPSDVDPAYNVYRVRTTTAGHACS